MKSRLLLGLSILACSLPLAAPAQASCGIACLSTLKEGQWVSDLDLITPSKLAIYSARAVVVCRSKKKKPVFYHDKPNRRQRFLCA